MQRTSDELKAEIIHHKANIARCEPFLEEDLKRASAWREYIANEWKSIRRLEGQLERENAPLVKPVGHCVTIDGWDV